MGRVVQTKTHWKQLSSIIKKQDEIFRDKKKEKETTQNIAQQEKRKK